MTVRCDHGAWLHPDVVFGGDANIGFNSCIGYGASDGTKTFIGDGVCIGAFCIIEHGVHIADGVEIDHYCRVSSGTQIEANTRILYRAQIFDNVKIGSNCIIAGELVDRAVVESQVTFQGNTAHSHTDPTRDWDETEEPSPIIRTGSVVGIGALLIGGVSVGPRAYVAAGEIVKCDVPEGNVLQGGKLWPIAYFRGLIKVRGS